MNYKNNIIVYILFLIIAIYFSQGWLYGRGDVISRTMLIIWLIIDVFYFIKYVNEFRIKPHEWLIVIFIIINFLSWLFGDKLVISAQGWYVNTLGDVKNIMTFLLSYFPFSYFLKKKKLTDGDFRFFFWVMLIVSINIYLSNSEVLLEYTNKDNVTNNYAYCFVLLFPFLGFFFEKRFKYILLVVFLYFIMTGAKRGAVVCFFVEAVLLFYFSLFSLSRKKQIRGILGIMAGLALFVISIVFLYNSNDYLQYRLDLMLSGDESGRDIIRTNLISAYRSGSLYQKIFGWGMDQTIVICGEFAHNDWIQLLIDTGLVGTVVYFLLFLNLFRFYFRNKNNMEAKLRFIYLSAILCWALKSIFSMGYTDVYSYLFFPPIVYVQATVQQQK